MMDYLLLLLPVRWWTRRCNGCSDPRPGHHHLTRLGRKALGVKR